MKWHFRTWILSLGTVFMIPGVVLIFIFSTSVADAEKRDVESSTGQFIAQLPDDIPDFVKNILEEEGINLEEILEELKDNPELRREMREKVMDNPDIREEFQEKVAEMRAHEEPPQGKSEVKQRDHKGDKRKGKVDEYYKSIVDNNLFRPLGWGGEDKRGPAFRLIGTVIAKNKKPKALIFEFANKTTHYVAAGDKIGKATVKSIDEKSVTLNQDGEEEPLKLNIVQESPFLGGSAGGKGGGGGPKEGGSPSPSPPKNVKSDRSGGEKSGENWREKLKNMSPEERKKIIQTMRENRKGGGGGDFRRIERLRRR